MKRTLILVAIIAGTVVPALGQIEWVAYEGNPVIPEEFDNEAQTIYRPSVLKWQGKYHLWYGKLWQERRWVAYTSSDDGITWSNVKPQFDNAVIGYSATKGEFDEQEATHPSVILDQDTLKMWYGGVGSDASGIGFAWSLNGTDWTRVAGPAAGHSVLDPASDGSGARFVTQPTVAKVNDVYHMWYVRLVETPSVLGYESRLGYAQSSNGLSWQVVGGDGTDGAVLDLGAGGDFDAYSILWPTVLYNSNQGYFELWYQGLGPDPVVTVATRVGCARSADGVVWQKIADTHAEAGECFRTLGQPSVLLEDDMYKMWYALSATGHNDEVIMYATSEVAGTANEETELPQLVAGLEIYPNPTASRAMIRFDLAQSGALQLEVRDILGRLVTRDDLGARLAGSQIASWAGTDDSGRPAPPGAYLITLVNSSTGLRSAGGIVYVVR